MWLDATPPADDVLRQGDLLQGIPFPRRGTLELDVEGMRASVYPSRSAVVLDQCCTVEQRWTVLLGRVGDVRRLPADHTLAQALVNDEPREGAPYSKYFHLLEDVEGVIPFKERKQWVIEMTERVSIGVKSAEDLRWLQGHRVRRMETPARARLRARLMYHFTEVTDEDRAVLLASGFDLLGRQAC